MKNFFVKEFIRDNDKLVAACDAEIAGKIFEEENVSINVRENFYCDKKCDEKELVDMMRSSTMLNLVGNKCVQVAIDNGLISKENVLNISGVMHAQVVVMK